MDDQPPRLTVVPIRPEPRAPVSDITAMLRQLADDLDRGDRGYDIWETLLLTWQTEDGTTCCAVYGENPPRYEVAGMFLAAANKAAGGGWG